MKWGPGVASNEIGTQPKASLRADTMWIRTMRNWEGALIVRVRRSIRPRHVDQWASIRPGIFLPAVLTRGRWIVTFEARIMTFPGNQLNEI